jgi:hypothetical protein
MSTPRTETIPRAGHETRPAGDWTPHGAATWADVTTALRTGGATTWLSARGPSGVHTRPVFAAWAGSSFVLCSNPRAVKTHRLEADGACSLALDLTWAHLVVEGTARRLRSPEDLARASTAMHDVYGWPTELAPEGELLTAPYAAPTSGGPPFTVWEIAPERAFAFPTNDQFEPTRFVF